MPPNSESDTDAFDSLYREFIRGNPDEERRFQKQWLCADIGREIRELREHARLTQKELARSIRTAPSVISRIEQASYGLPTLSMLSRIAVAFEAQLQVRLADAR